MGRVRKQGVGARPTKNSDNHTSVKVFLCSIYIFKRDKSRTVKFCFEYSSRLCLTFDEWVELHFTVVPTNIASLPIPPLPI